MMKSYKKWIAPTIFGAFGLGIVPSVMADNPIIQTYYSPDPAPVVFGDTLCSYSGNDEGGSFFTMHGWRVSCTTDMVNWTDMGELILEAGDFNGSAKKNGDWAAQVIRRKDASGKYKYYYYVTVESTKGGRAINVAVADTKEGPFKDALNGKHLAGPNWDYIDPTVWIDDDGKAYLYWGNPKLYFCPLKDNMIECDGGVQLTDMASFNGKYTEGPWIHKRGKKYYMIYAAGGVPESIDYSWSDKPTSGWQYKGTIMPSSEPGSAFTVHSGIVDFQGRSFFFYHNQRRVPSAGGYSRTSAVEEFTWGADGTIPTIRMTDDGVTKPIKNLDPYEKVQAETKAWVEGITVDKAGGYTIIKNVESEGKTVYLTNMNAGSWTKVRSVDMSDGADNIVVCTKGGSGVIELHSGSATGPLMSTIKVPASDTWQENSFEVTGADGVADLYFVFKSGNFKFDYWYFETSATAVPQEPFGGKAWAIPGKIEAEDFDKPGKGRGNSSFQDSDTENHSCTDEGKEAECSEYRSEDAPAVDIYKKSATRTVVGYITNGEWLEYTVDVAKDGDYTMYAAVASDGGSSFKLSVDGEDVTEDIAVPAARKSEDDAQNFDSYSKVSADVKLTKGQHILRFTATADWFDIDYFNFVAKGEEDPCPIGAESCGDNKDALVKNFQVVNAGASYNVFDMQGKKLGMIHSNGANFSEAMISAGFSKGVYMLRNVTSKKSQMVKVK
ncbi:family 43 glycosylhydrolase [Fibrobacter sp. UWEL]|uniref:family 43 glycosylhydrolase n=1 Tax=Fibrobacter sp. UWEL TaxID=1896209 RepID=UPI00091F7B6B|nr:family 43 glycosylhydrolase [Fibrobacter sp. UWEL]SHL22871.1 Por secretion system C-terminal sorting domain-containing protein [Fibrobacter sp. UWEL]